MSDMAIAELNPRKITVPEFFYMGHVGILKESERVELIDGALVAMSPLGHAHTFVAGRALRYLIETLGHRAEVLGPMMLPLGRYDAPQPDIAILAPDGDVYFKRAPEPAQIYALIEVADSSAGRDVTVKRDLYASFNVQEYLVCDIRNATLVRWVTPTAGTYTTQQLLTYGDSFSLVTLPGVKINVDPFLPPR